MRNPAFSSRLVICGTVSVRNDEREAARRPLAAALLDVLLVEDRQLPRAILPDRFDQRDARLAAAPQSTEADLVAVFLPDRQIGHEIDAEDAAAREHALDRGQRRLQIGLSDERLQDAVRRHHEIEPRRLAERKKPDVAAQPCRAVRARRDVERFSARPSISADRSTPTMRAPVRATGIVTRPVPHPSSRIGPFARSAIACQNFTSRRSSVCAFSQS